MWDIEIINVKKRYKSKREGYVEALKGINLKIKKGELFGLLGPNGAGKTTLIKCISTLLIPDEGEIKVLGRDVQRDPIFVRQNIGLVIGGERTLYWKLSVIDNLMYFSSLYGLSPKRARRRVEELINLMNLEEKARERVERLSTGMRQKVVLARALLHDPQVLLLDEPTLGLDPSFSRVIRDFIKNYLNKEKKKTILLTTHYMEEAEELCERIAFINEGKIIDCASPEELKTKIPFDRVLEIKFTGNVEKSQIDLIKYVEKSYILQEDSHKILKVHTQEPEEVLNSVLDVVRRDARILQIRLHQPTLEDVFIHLTGAVLR